MKCTWQTLRHSVIILFPVVKVPSHGILPINMHWNSQNIHHVLLPKEILRSLGVPRTRIWINQFGYLGKKSAATRSSGPTR